MRSAISQSARPALQPAIGEPGLQPAIAAPCPLPGPQPIDYPGPAACQILAG
jgi:hypothetical protein